MKWRCWGTKMRERWFSKCLTSVLCFSIWLSAPRLTCSLALLTAGVLLQVQLSRPMTHRWAPPSLPATSSWLDTSHSHKTCAWKLSSASHSLGCFPPSWLALCYDLELLSTCTHFLTSPSGNGSCPATIMLFSSWSALISFPQLVSGPEAKVTQKGKQCRKESWVFWHASLLLLLIWSDASKMIVRRLASLVAAFPHAAAPCSTRHLHTDYRLNWRCYRMSSVFQIGMVHSSPRAGRHIW